MSKKKKEKLLLVAPFRAYENERDELQKRAREAGLSLNRYLIECGLMPKIQPDPMERAMREAAIFKVHMISVRLEKILKTSNLKLDSALIEELKKVILAAEDNLNELRKAYSFHFEPSKH